MTRHGTSLTKSEAQRETLTRRHLYMAEGEIKLVEELIAVHGPTSTLKEVLENWRNRRVFWEAQVQRLRGTA